MKIFCMVLLTAYALMVNGQDILTTQSGDELRVKVVEISASTIKYRVYENPTGPMHTIAKSEVFMITYENGTKDVFSQEKSEEVNGTATIYFYRPRKFANGGTQIIVGTVVPDEVVVKLKNGHWYKDEYQHLGERQFVSGIFVINPQVYEVTLTPDETYYFRCTPLNKGFKVMAELTMVDAEIARTEMAGLKEQRRNYVD